MGVNSFLYEMAPISMGYKNENDRVAFPDNVLIHLKTSSSFCNAFLYNTALRMCTYKYFTLLFLLLLRMYKFSRLNLAQFRNKSSTHGPKCAFGFGY